MFYRLPKELPPNGERLHDSITQEPGWFAAIGAFPYQRRAWLTHVFFSASGRGRNTTPAAWLSALQSAVLTACPVVERQNAGALIAQDIAAARLSRDVAECVEIVFRRGSALDSLALELARRGLVTMCPGGVEIVGMNPATDAVQRG